MIFLCSYFIKNNNNETVKNLFKKILDVTLQFSILSPTISVHYDNISKKFPKFDKMNFKTFKVQKFQNRYLKNFNPFRMVCFYP